ncbi:MAG: hypothetical protein ACM3S2_14055 [Ignavibacteriales bacterium]
MYYRESENNGLQNINTGIEMNFISLVDESISTLGDFGKRINSFINSEEKEFISIGNSLQQFYVTVREITQMTSTAANLISDEIVESGINRLNRLLGQISSYLSNSSREIRDGESTLQEILDILANVVNNLSGFNRIIKHLRILGISTKIESARLISDNNGFNILAENVEKLSTIISDKAKNIRLKSTHLIELISQAISKIISIEKKQNEHTSQILENLHDGLNVLNERYSLCLNRTAFTSRNSDAVSHNIGKIVTALQFHDITRQQLEHVNESIEGLRKRIYEENMDDLTEGDGNKKELAGYIYNVCTLQSMHLVHSKEELVKAIANIIQSLDNVEAGVSEMFSEMSGLLGASETGESTFISELESGLLSISSDLSKSSEIRSELAASMKSVAATVQELTSFVGEIEEIGSEIEIIALNARVKAAHTGDEGAALGILAESIQRLSIDSKQETASVSVTLKKISEIAGSLYSSTDFESGNEKARTLETVKNEIVSLIKALNDSDRNSVQQLGRIRNITLKLRNDIEKTIQGIKIHENAETCISGLNENLQSIIYRIEPHVDHVSLKKQNTLSELAEKYTMDSERLIHHSYADKIIEPSGIVLNGQEHEPGENSEGDFGDNVELF